MLKRRSHRAAADLVFALGLRGARPRRPPPARASGVRARSLRVCPTLRDPADFSPQARPWASPGKNTGVGCHFHLQEIFPTQGSNLCLLCVLHRQVGSLPPSQHLSFSLCIDKGICLRTPSWLVRSPEPAGLPPGLVHPGPVGQGRPGPRCGLARREGALVSLGGSRCPRPPPTHTGPFA